MDSKIWFFFLSSTKILPQSKSTWDKNCRKLRKSWGRCPSIIALPLHCSLIFKWSWYFGRIPVIHVSNIEDHILQLLDLLVFFFLLVTFSSNYSAISTSGVSQMRMKKPYWWFSYWSFNLLKFFKVVVTSTHTYLIAYMCLHKSRMSLPSGFSLFRIITVSQAVKPARLLSKYVILGKVRDLSGFMCSSVYAFCAPFLGYTIFMCFFRLLVFWKAL